MKSIKKANKIHKLIALWLVFVMLMTPLFEHVGPRNGAKAEENNDVPEVATAIEISGGGDVETTLLDTSDEDDTPDTKYIHTVKPTNVTDITVWTAGNNAKFKLSNNVVLNEGNVTATPGDEDPIKTSLYYAESSVEMGDLLYDGTSLQSYDEDFLQLDIDTGTTIYVYSKLNKDRVVYVSDSLEYPVAYVLQAKITVKNPDYGIATSVTWQNSGSDVTEAKEANVVGQGLWNERTPDAKNYYAGVTKYGYAPYDGTNVSYANYTSSTTWSAIPSDDGKYVGFVGYFANSTSTTPIEKDDSFVVVNTPEDKIVHIDKTAPNYGEVTLEYSATGTDSWSTQTVGGSEFITKATGYYRFKFKVNDENGVGLDSEETNVVAAYKTSNTDDTIGSVTKDEQYYYIKIPVSEIAQSTSAPTTVYVEIKDKLGNQIDGDTTTDGIQRIVLTPSLKQVKTGVEITAALIDGSGNAVKDITNTEILNNATLPTSIDNILKKTNVKYQLNITATSDVKFENIKVTYKNGSNEDKELTVSGHEYDSDEGTDGRYEDTLIFYIPENSNYSEVLDSIKVQYTLEGSSTPESKAIGKLVYDATAPEMEEETEGSGYLQYSVDGSNWITVDINSANTSNGVYYTNPDFRYRYIVKVTDPDVVSGISGSGVNKVYIDSSREFTEITDASTNTPVSGTPTGIFAYDITNALVNSASLSDTVYASDKSGNVTSGLQLPKLKKTDRAMLINAQVQDNNGNPVSISEITKYTNQGYKLVVTVSSGYEIAEIKLNKIDGTGNNIEYKKTNSLDDNPFDFVGSIDVYNRYTVVAEFDLSAVDNNEWFKNMYITAKDTAATPQTKRFPETEDTYLSDVLYDISEPVEVSSSGSQSSWLKENAFTFEYSSGTKDGSESPITSINYAVSDSTANTSGSISVSGTDTVVSNSGYNVPESTSLEGTKLTYTVTDAAGNTKNFSYNIKIDKTQPDIDLFVNEVKAFEAPLKTAPTIKAVYGDNLTINTVKVTIAGPNGTVVKELETSAIEQINVSKINSYSLASLYGTVVDGKYTVTAYIEDKAGNNRTTSAVSFTIDSTKADISSNIAEGTKSPKTGNYYSSNVGVYFTYKDASTVKPVIKDNDSLVSVDWKKNDDGSYSGYLIVNTEGAHKIAYAVTDSAGNVTNAADIDFILDKTSPVISTTLNNVSYTESKGVVYLTSNATVAVSVSDANEDVGDLNYRVTLTKPDQEAVTSQYVKTESRSFGFTDEGDYTVELYAIDKANNRCDNRSVSFRVDKTAPALTITGANSTTTNEQATVSFNMNEAFWWDASGTITVYRKDGDGIVERQIDTIEFKPTAKSTTISKTYSDTGVYRFEFEAKDKAGHTAMVGGSLTIDANKPTLSISALEADGSKADITNYSVTNQTVSFYAEMTDEFYANKVIQFQGTRTDIDGKVHNIDVSVMGAKANPSTITQDFEDDGTYDITITVTDIVGNEVTKSLHFTIDKTAPVIGDLSKYEGTKKSFDWDEDLEQLVSDLTVCDVHVYLNGREYDGTSDIEDGAYTLLVTAQDEINEMVEKSVEFVLDTKAPSFIITGVEDGEVKEEDYNISVSPQLDEDKLTSVTLNGQVVTITNNVATLTVNSKGDYTLHAEAIDEAGNESSIDISFTYGKKTNSMLWIIIIVAAVIVIGGVIFIIIKKSNKKNN